MSSPAMLWLQAAACAVLAAHAVVQLRRLLKLRSELQRAEEEAKYASDERKAERAGRVKAERELRQLQLRLGQLESSSLPEPAATGGSDGNGTLSSSGAGDGDQKPQQQQQQQPGGLDLLQVAFPLRPIGILRSCFSRRNGTPRQPLLVPAARARLTLRPELSAEFLEGLQGYSHCWVLYVFHENTDLQRLWQQAEAGSGVRAKIRVPRLDGGKLGVFATRSPHRPCPIGLSVAEVISVEGRTLVLGGADIVDGSPVLDIKPYVAFCDSVAAATAPSWVAAKAEDEPLHIGALLTSPSAEAALRRCWQQRGARSLYTSFEQYRQLLEQVLSRDIRSVTQRIKVPQRSQHGGPAALSSSSSGSTGSSSAAASSGGGGGGQAGAAAEAAEGFWKVVLDGIQISYDVAESSSDVVLRTAALAAAPT